MNWLHDWRVNAANKSLSWCHEVYLYETSLLQELAYPKSRFTKIFQSRFISVKVALFKSLNEFPWVVHICEVAMAKVLVSVRTDGYQMKEEDLLY